MKAKIAGIVFFLLIIFSGLIAPKIVLATTFNLSGKISDSSGNGIPNAIIAVIDTTTNNSVANTTSDASGNYTVSVNGGTYNIQVNPPANSNFISAIAPSRSISSDTIVNFILTPSGVVTLSGHILGPLGNPLPNQVVGMGFSGHPISTTTDANGYYALQTTPGTQFLDFYSQSANDLSLSVPQNYLIESTSASYSITQNTVLDVTIPAKKITVHVQDASNNPVSNITIGASQINTNSTNLTIPGVSTAMQGGSSYNSSSGPKTDTSGNATLWLIPGNYNLFATPPSGSNFSLTQVPNMSITGDTQQTITLIQSVTLSGHIHDPLGNPLPDQTIQVGFSGNTITKTTDANGFYSIQTTPGTQFLEFFATNPLSLNAPQHYLLDSGGPVYSITQNTVLDVTIPAKKVTVHVQDFANNPVSNVIINANQLGNTNINLPGVPNVMIGSSSYGSYGTGPATDSSGNVTLWLIAGNYTFTAKPSSGSNFSQTQLTNISITGDTQQTITLIQPVTLSGHIYGPLGNPLPNQTVGMGFSGHPITATTDVNGYYSLQTTPGNNFLNFYPVTTNSFSLNAPQYYLIQTQAASYSITQNTVLDVTIPAKKITVHVQDASNNPVSNVVIGTSENGNTGVNLPGLPSGLLTASSSYGNRGLGPATDASGNVTLWLIPGNYNLFATPPSGSIYAQFILYNISITNDQTEIISLQFVHAAPVTTAILTTRLSDETYSDPTTVSLSAVASSGFTVTNTYYTVDGGAKQIYTTPFTVSGSGSHMITYWSIDSLGVSETPNTKSFSIDDPPKISSIPGATINEGSTYTATGSFTDTDSSSWTGTVDYGDGQGTQPLTINPDKTFTLSHQYLDNKPNNAPYTVTVNITDNQGAGSTVTTSVVVLNVTPSVGSITVQSNPVIQGSPFSVNSVIFSDPGVLDTHTAIWNWGDGTTSPGTVVETNGSGYVSATDHVYSAVGTYQITLTVTDNDGAPGTSVFQYAVVYQPSRSGLFSGHSIFASPNGADLQNPNVTGNVHFAVDIKYANNSNVPTGKVSMDFSSGKISLIATSFRYLVINGTQAILTGSGTVNGTSGYSFLVSGIDGTQTGTGYIRFQIIDPAGNVIYDTQTGAAVNAAPTTAVTGGMIVVHN